MAAGEELSARCRSGKVSSPHDFDEQLEFGNFVRHGSCPFEFARPSHSSDSGRVF
jgi:hypothetical protein